MREMNFFKPYSSKHRIGISGNDAVKYGVGGILALTVLFYGITALDIFLTNRDTDQINARMSQPEFVKKLKHYNEVQRKLQSLNQYDNIVTPLNKGIEEAFMINSDYMAQLNSVFPQHTFLQTSSLQDGSFELQGISANRIEIAEYEHNLNKLDIFKSVYVTNINQNASGSGYMFTVKCIVKGWVEKK